MGDAALPVLYMFPRVRTLNMSPPCVKAEAFLRRHRIPYVARYVTNPSCSPSGRVPYIEYRGTSTHDSEYIMLQLRDALVAEGKAEPEVLSADEHATAVMLRRLVEDSNRLHFARYLVVDRAEYLVALVPFIPGPHFVKSIIFSQFMRKPTVNMLNQHGQGDLLDVEYEHEFHENVVALEQVLSRHRYALRDEITDVDMTLFGYLESYRIILDAEPTPLSDAELAALDAAALDAAAAEDRRLLGRKPAPASTCGSAPPVISDAYVTPENPSRLRLCRALQRVFRSPVIHAYYGRLRAELFPDAAHLTAAGAADRTEETFRDFAPMEAAT